MVEHSLQQLNSCNSPQASRSGSFFSMTTSTHRDSDSSISEESKQSIEQKKYQSYVGSALVDSGVRHYSRGENGKALKAFYAALSTQRLTLEKDNVCIGHTLSNIGAVLLRQKRLDDATHALKESLKIKRKRLALSGSTEEKNQQVKLHDTLNNLGNCYYYLGKYDESLSCYSEALAELQKEACAMNKHVANTLHNIGKINMHQKKYNTALASLKVSLEVTRVVYGNDHIHVSDTLELIASIYLSKKKHGEALSAFFEVLEVTKAALGPYHIDVAASYYNVGTVQEIKGDLKDAWESYMKARKIYERAAVEQDNEGLTAVRQSIGSIVKQIAEEKAKERNTKGKL